MGCLHPPVLTERVTRPDGAEGIRCLACGMSAYAGDARESLRESFWSVFKRWLRSWA